MKRTVGPWKYPRWIEFVDSLPKTATGKIQRFMLRDRGDRYECGSPLMAPLAHLAWPFFGEPQRQFAAAAGGLGEQGSRPLYRSRRRRSNPAGRSCARSATPAGSRPWCRRPMAGCPKKSMCARICPAREILAWHDSLADFAFAMQGLGTGSITLFGSDAMKAKYLPPVRDGRHIAAFALSEPEAGSDVECARDHRGEATGPPCAHRRHQDLDLQRRHRRPLRGVRTHRRSARRQGPFRFRRRRRHAGPGIAGRIDVIAPHPLATLRFTGCRVPLANRLGGPGEGFKVAMATLDIFRSTVAAAALGLARRAFDEMIEQRGDAQSVRRAARRPADDASRARRQRDRDRCRGAADLSRRLDQGSRRRAHHPRSVDRQNPCHRKWRNA